VAQAGKKVDVLLGGAREIQNREADNVADIKKELLEAAALA
jgi:hypothetical protein